MSPEPGLSGFNFNALLIALSTPCFSLRLRNESQALLRFFEINCVLVSTSHHPSLM